VAGSSVVPVMAGGGVFSTAATKDWIAFCLDFLGSFVLISGAGL